MEQQENIITQDLTEEQRKEIRKTFDAFDADGDGRVTTEEMGTIIRAFFIVANDKMLSAFLRKLDKHDNGYVDYVDFEKFMIEEDLAAVTHDEMDDDLCAAFEFFDKDGNGIIDAEEFKEVMVSLDMESDLVFRKSRLPPTYFVHYLQRFKVRSAQTKTAHNITLGDKFSVEEAEAMMKEADTNGDGKIDYKEFSRHMKKHLLLN